MKRSHEKTREVTIPYFGLDVLKMFIIQYPRIGLTCRAAADILTRDKFEIIKSMPPCIEYFTRHAPISLSELFVLFDRDTCLQNTYYYLDRDDNTVEMYRGYCNDVVRTIAKFVSEDDTFATSVLDVKDFKLLSVKVSLFGVGSFADVKMSVIFHYDEDERWISSLNIQNAAGIVHVAVDFYNYIRRNENSVISSATLGLIGKPPRPNTVYNRDIISHIKYTPFIDTPRFRYILDEFITSL